MACRALFSQDVKTGSVVSATTKIQPLSTKILPNAVWGTTFHLLNCWMRYALTLPEPPNSERVSWGYLELLPPYFSFETGRSLVLLRRDMSHLEHQGAITPHGWRCLGQAWLKHRCTGPVFLLSQARTPQVITVQYKHPGFGNRETCAWISTLPVTSYDLEQVTSPLQAMASSSEPNGVQK